MIITEVKNFKKNVKKRWADAGHHADNMAWSRSYARMILPSRIEVFDTNSRIVTGKQIGRAHV